MVVVTGADATATPLTVTPVTPEEARLMFRALVKLLPRPVMALLVAAASEADVASTVKATLAAAVVRRRSEPAGASVTHSRYL